MGKLRRKVLVITGGIEGIRLATGVNPKTETVS